jgi:hypothetical protein
MILSFRGFFRLGISTIGPMLTLTASPASMPRFRRSLIECHGIRIRPSRVQSRCILIFQPYGAFKVPTKHKLIDTGGLSRFWKDIDNSYPGLPGARGCYIFALRAGGGIRPCYVGLNSRTCFKAEVLSPHKLVLLSKAIQSQGKGTLLMYLLADETPGGKFRNSRRKSLEVMFLENALIAACLQRNPDLLNKKQTKFLKEMSVPGFMNDSAGARSKSAREMASLLGTSGRERKKKISPTSSPTDAM